MTLYDSRFYAGQSEGSRRSAAIIVPIVMGAIEPQSIIDIGCGVGAWLAEFERAGISDYLGIDGEYVSQEQLCIPQQRFRAADLRHPVVLDRRYDLAVSLEVAEHLPLDQAEGFVASLARLAPMVLFSAAIPFQGGTGHVNEQWQEFWRQLFSDQDFVPVDCVRPQVWGNHEVCWWYQQNMLLYVDRSKIKQLKGVEPVPRWRKVDVVHPALFEGAMCKSQDPSKLAAMARSEEPNTTGAIETGRAIGPGLNGNRQNSPANTKDPWYSIEIVVEALYRGILCRAPDEIGFLNHIRHLQSLAPDTRNLAIFVRSFLSSKEYRKQLANPYKK